jgi:translation initiation factor 1 (eIF-1/SUI1)
VSGKSSRLVYSTAAPGRPAVAGGAGDATVASAAGGPGKSAGRPTHAGASGGPSGHSRSGGADPGRLEPLRSLPPWEQEVRVRREKAGRGGKEVTVAGPLVLLRADAAALLTGLKRRYGSGGALRPSRTRGGEPCFELELQGDQADRLVADLLAGGYRAKRAGG